jgi:hypothetical protein
MRMFCERVNKSRITGYKNKEIVVDIYTDIENNIHKKLAGTQQIPKTGVQQRKQRPERDMSYSTEGGKIHGTLM